MRKELNTHPFNCQLQKFYVLINSFSEEKKKKADFVVGG